MAQVSETARTYGLITAAKLFSGRTGHGGGPCTKRNLTEAEIAAIMALAFEAGRKSVTVEA